jgi:hypothetical protein
MRFYLSSQFAVICLVAALKSLAQPLIHTDGILNVALTEAIFPAAPNLCAHAQLNELVTFFTMHCFLPLPTFSRSFLLFSTRIGGSSWSRGARAQFLKGVSSTSTVMAAQQPTGALRYVSLRRFLRQCTESSCSRSSTSCTVPCLTAESNPTLRRYFHVPLHDASS